MRGKDQHVNVKHATRGITPAYAGKSYIQQFTRKFFRDHPRLCGEKGECVDLVKKHLGITPAYAGKR